MAEFKTRVRVLLLSVFILALVFFVDSIESEQHQISDGSSLLESIIGKYGGFERSLVFPLHKIDQGRVYAEFTHLPGKRFTDFGIGTRRLLLLQLHKIDEGREYGEFMHLPRKRFYDLASVSKEIEDEIEGETGSGKGISSVPIHLSIYSPDGSVDMRLGINKSVDMVAARHRELKYFASTPEYRHNAHRMGSEHLGKMLSKKNEIGHRILTDNAYPPYASLAKDPSEEHPTGEGMPIWVRILIAVLGTAFSVLVLVILVSVIRKYYPNKIATEPQGDIESGRMGSSSSSSTVSDFDAYINPLVII